METPELPETMDRKEHPDPMLALETCFCQSHLNASAKLCPGHPDLKALADRMDHPGTQDHPAPMDALDHRDLPAHQETQETPETQDRGDHLAHPENSAQPLLHPPVAPELLVVPVPLEPPEKVVALETMAALDNLVLLEIKVAPDSLVALATLELPEKPETLVPLEAATIVLQLVWLLVIRRKEKNFIFDISSAA
jgi:hypothetical protein